MRYGVRRDLQEQLVKEGYRMRVYVPFGTQWYPYLMRLAEVKTLLDGLVRERTGGSSRKWWDVMRDDG
jgi:proline dehydrogenase